MTDSTINDEEVARFSAMAEEWWNPKGKFRPLHKFNPVRIAYVRDKGWEGSVAAVVITGHADFK